LLPRSSHPILRPSLASPRAPHRRAWTQDQKHLSEIAKADECVAQNQESLKLLSVQVNRLRRWYQSGLLCIGDAAHAMSPVGGVGINLAIQDAVAAANALAHPLLKSKVESRHLRAVQRRREPPIRIIQGLQSLAHRRVVAPAVGSDGIPSPPTPVKALLRSGIVRDLLARIIAFGIWPVHVRS
jgi:2-polyprenyl-6-methoxyphenol hydroxylase-like FAD-dependent oxidoreductase